MKVTISRIKLFIVVALTLYTITIGILFFGFKEKSSWFQRKLKRAQSSEIKVVLDEDEDEMYEYSNTDKTNNAENDNTIVEERDSNFIKIGDIYVFSAFFDNRPNIKPQIRIIAIQKFNSSQTIGCAFRYQNHWIRVYGERHEMSENHGRFYGGWMYFCDVPHQFINQTSKELIVFDINLFNGHNLDILVPINITSSTYLDATKPNLFGQYIDDIGLCIPPLFGDLNLSMLLQFLELGKIQGISHFTIYLYQVSDSIKKILEHYQEKGDVTLIDWILPPSISSREIWYNGQMLTIQDCLYRNMARTRYLGFMDLDEFIIPVEFYSLKELIKSYHKRFLSISNISAFSFQSAFFDPKQLPDPSQQLKVLQLLKRNSRLSKVRTKLLTIPQNIFELGIHHVSRPINETMQVIFVDPDIAKIHHYRACIINFEPDMTCYKDVYDKTILKYSSDLIQNYKDALKNTLHLFVPETGLPAK